MKRARCSLLARLVSDHLVFAPTESPVAVTGARRLLCGRSLKMLSRVVLSAATAAGERYRP